MNFNFELKQFAKYVYEITYFREHEVMLHGNLVYNFSKVCIHFNLDKTLFTYFLCWLIKSSAPNICFFFVFFVCLSCWLTIWRHFEYKTFFTTIIYLFDIFWKIGLVSGYMAPNSAALAVAEIFEEKERPQKITLDIGAGTGLVAEEVFAPCQFNVYPLLVER